MGLDQEERERIGRELGAAVVEVRPLAQGNDSHLWALRLQDGRRLCAKCGGPSARLELEGRMLRHLAQAAPTLPVPAVWLAQPRLLVTDLIAAGDPIDAAAEVDAADLIATLHQGTPAARYGFACDTLIGPLPQANPENDDWIAFFRDQRLLGPARLALKEGRLEPQLLARLERLAQRLPELLGPPARPCLIHGDLWGGNVLVRHGRIAGLIDPALYHADPEIELAFTTLFGTFGERFFARYQEHRPLRPGFFELRRDLYNLYPLLVHLRLFGRSYLSPIERTVRRLVG